MGGVLAAFWLDLEAYCVKQRYMNYQVWFTMTTTIERSCYSTTTRNKVTNFAKCKSISDNDSSACVYLRHIEEECHATVVGVLLDRVNLGGTLASLIQHHLCGRCF